jgi:hypothetical protein
MKIGYKGITFLAIAALIMLSACATGPKPGYFANKSPEFNVSYPEDWISADLTNETEVLRVKDARGLPVLTSTVRTIPKGYVLAKDAPEGLVDALKLLGGDQLKIVSKKDATLVDGTQAYESIVQWNHPMLPGLVSMSLSTIKGDKVISVTLTTKGMPSEEQKKIPYTLRFK